MLRVGPLSLVLLVSTTASAQDAAPAPPESAPPASSVPEDAEAATRAREHFREGMQHFEARNFREAVRAFQLAASLVPSADLWFNIARGYEELDEHEAAIEHYRRYLRDRVDPPDRGQVEQRIASLEERAEAARLARNQAPTTGTMRLSANLDASTVNIDERAAGRTPVMAPLSLSPGRHRLQLSHEGYIPFRADVRVEAGVSTAAYADLVPMTRYRSIRGRRVFTWIVAGLAGAALITSVVLGVHARSIAGDAQTQLDMGMSGMADSTFQDARRWGAISDYVLGSALVLAVGAIVLYFVEGRSVATERVEPDRRPRTPTAGSASATWF